jgi:hypothetical protein
MLKILYWKHVLCILKCQYTNGVALTRPSHNTRRLQSGDCIAICVLSSLVAQYVVLRNENYDLSLIHRSLKVCHLLNTVIMKKKYCQCLPICNSSMPEITTTQLINITYFNTTKCDYYNTLSKHFIETTVCQTKIKMSFKELKMLMSF